jgi:predicted metal-dependent phosphoesterase TrpH
MKCDLHVHTVYSGMCTVPLMNRICKESFTSPEEAYAKLKRLGMGLVTITDHDSMGVVQVLGKHPDFFASEEVTVELPGGSEAHVAVYDLNERQHGEVQRRAKDMPSFIAYCREQDLFFSINHVFSSLTGSRTEADFELFAEHFPGMEVRNAAMLRSANRAASDLCGRWNKAPVAGSDAHALRSVGRAYTEVPGARDKAEFLAGLRAGRGIAHGGDGSYFLLTAEVLSIVRSLLIEKPWALTLLPLLSLLPLVLLVNYGKESLFAAVWQARLRSRPMATPSLEVAG